MPLSVQNDVPIPRAIRPAYVRTRKYPVDRMQVGEMFFVPNRDRNTLSTYIAAQGKKLGRKFTTRLIYMQKQKQKQKDHWQPCEHSDEGAVLGIGVWRVE